jgi:hypothetical protein
MTFNDIDPANSGNSRRASRGPPGRATDWGTTALYSIANHLPIFDDYVGHKMNHRSDMSSLRKGYQSWHTYRSHRWSRVTSTKQRGMDLTGLVKGILSELVIIRWKVPSGARMTGSTIRP